MAIAKGKALQRRHEGLAVDLARAEIEIDEALSSPNGSYTFSCSKYKPEVIDELIRRYMRVGWKVMKHSDPRDGSYLEFL